MGGAPLANLEKLGPTYRLISIPSEVAKKLNLTYHETTVTYVKMNPEAVPTLAVECLLVSKVYKSPKFVNALSLFRKTFYEKLTELQETPGNHPKWAQVAEGNHGKWQWLSLPGDKP